MSCSQDAEVRVIVECPGGTNKQAERQKGARKPGGERREKRKEKKEGEREGKGERETERERERERERDVVLAS